MKSLLIIYAIWSVTFCFNCHGQFQSKWDTVQLHSMVFKENPELQRIAHGKRNIQFGDSSKAVTIIQCVLYLFNYISNFQDITGVFDSTMQEAIHNLKLDNPTAEENTNRITGKFTPSVLAILDEKLCSHEYRRIRQVDNEKGLLFYALILKCDEKDFSKYTLAREVFTSWDITEIVRLIDQFPDLISDYTILKDEEEVEVSFWVDIRLFVRILYKI